MQSATADAAALSDGAYSISAMSRPGSLPRLPGKKNRDAKGAKAQTSIALFSAGLKRSSPRMNAGAPTEEAPQLGYRGTGILGCARWPKDHAVNAQPGVAVPRETWIFWTALGAPCKIALG
jgi:hypothetical protein